MQCIAHPTRAASNTCSICNHWLCDECTVNTGGRILCRSCITSMNIATHEDSPPDVVKTYAPTHKHISWGQLFLFSFLFPPGANYMYMGLIKRGLAAMCGFFMLIYLVVTISGVMFTLLFALMIPILWLTCLFDGFHIRRRINSGEVVEDGVGDILSNVLRNKTLTLAILIVITLAFAGSIIGFAVELIRRAVPILLIALALYIIFRRKR